MSDILITECSLDELYRVRIPSGICHTLSWKPGEALKIFLQDPVNGSVCLQRAVNVCSFCGGKQEVCQVKRARICAECVRELRQQS